VSASAEAGSPNYLLRRSQLTSLVMVKIGHFVAITVLFLSSALAFGQIQFVYFPFKTQALIQNRYVLLGKMLMVWKFENLTKRTVFSSVMKTSMTLKEEAHLYKQPCCNYHCPFISMFF
jgi:hypothetical protein